MEPLDPCAKVEEIGETRPPSLCHTLIECSHPISSPAIELPGQRMLDPQRIAVIQVIRPGANGVCPHCQGHFLSVQGEPQICGSAQPLVRAEITQTARTTRPHASCTAYFDRLQSIGCMTFIIQLLPPIHPALWASVQPGKGVFQHVLSFDLFQKTHHAAHPVASSSPS